jgi:hypothetical protein
MFSFPGLSFVWFSRPENNVNSKIVDLQVIQISYLGICLPDKKLEKEYFKIEHLPPTAGVANLLKKWAKMLV